VNVRILLIDDDAELGAMLAEYLGAEGFETSVVLNGETGVEEALTGSFDAVILDVMLPGLGGVEVLRRIRQSARTPVIMLTAKGDYVDRIVGLEMGADDYVPKPCYPRELVARLRAVLRRTSGNARSGAEDALVVGGLRISQAQRRAEWNGRAIELTATEFNLLEALVKDADRVLTKDELSEKALGRPREMYDRSVDVHMSNLRHKLGGAGLDVFSIETVRGVGYMMRRR
jgi:DNA-binding response OmpR family regulator